MAPFFIRKVTTVLQTDPSTFHHDHQGTVHALGAKSTSLTTLLQSIPHGSLNLRDALETLLVSFNGKPFSVIEIFFVCY